VSRLALLGGTPVRTKEFAVRVTMGAAEKAAAMRVLDADSLSEFVGAPGEYFNGGKEVRGFEALWCRMYGFRHGVAMNSLTTGLQAALGAIGIAPGDEVICPPYTMSATATAVLFYGGIPVFADVESARLTIDPACIEGKITPRTKAIMVVHLFGYPADMDAIMAIAAKHGLKVIEDAAQAPGVLYRGRPVGAIGHIGGFSLNYHKQIHSGEGGLMVTDDDSLALRMRLIRNHGENVTEAHKLEDIANLIGSNYRFTELQAAIATEQLKRLKGLIAHRMALAEALDFRLGNIPGLGIQKREPGSTHGYYMYPIRFDENAMDIPRNLFMRAVNAELPKPKYWNTTPLYLEGYVRPLYLNPIYQRKIALGRKGFPFNANPGVSYEYPRGLCPVAERLHEKELLLCPLLQEAISVADINDFADAVEKVVREKQELMNLKTKEAVPS
jgi:perosamine synthetase